jgi:hypothetical protein
MSGRAKVKVQYCQHWGQRLDSNLFVTLPYHQERNHQGKGNVLLFPSSNPAGGDDGPMQCRERLGGLLKYYERKAA